MKLQPLNNAVCLGCRECLIQRACRVGGEIVHHDTDPVRIGIVDIGKIAHADGKILGGSLVRHLHMTPRPVRIEEHKQVGGATAAVFAVVTLRLARLSRRA